MRSAIGCVLRLFRIVLCAMTMAWLDRSLSCAHQGGLARDLDGVTVNLGEQLPADLELAKAHCRSCPLRGSCLSGAVERGEPHGRRCAAGIIHGAAFELLRGYARRASRPLADVAGEAVRGEQPAHRLVVPPGAGRAAAR